MLKKNVEEDQALREFIDVEFDGKESPEEGVEKL